MTTPCIALESVDTESLKVERLLAVFNTLFADKWRTKLVRGEGEPIYLPARDDSDFHQIVFAHGFFSSALHEISHWLVAGQARRQLEDFGYWYKPDGRTVSEQQLFESVEVKPQAIEWYLAQCCQHKFYFSADNLSGEVQASEQFKARVVQQAQRFVTQPMTLRMQLLVEALTIAFSQPLPEISDFAISKG